MAGEQELYSIKQELQRIIDELENVASGINNDFEGIGNEKCASRLYELAGHYLYVKAQLNKIDTSKVKGESSGTVPVCQ